MTKEPLEACLSPTVINSRKTHCIHGHKLSGYNLRLKYRKDGVRRDCRKCHNEQRRRDKERLRPIKLKWQKEWRKNNPEKAKISDKKKSDKYRIKSRIVSKVQWAVKTGKLIKPEKCECCERNHKRIEGHHMDYDKPFEVIWLCRICHVYTHRIIDLTRKHCQPKENNG